MGCSNCCKCFQQADGTIVKRGERDGAYIYTLQDLTVSSTAPASFVTTTEVDCAKFDSATLPPRTIQVLEEVDDTGTQTGVLVQVRELADGSTEYVNLADQSTYTRPAGYTLHTSEDTDYNERTLQMCDNGIDVVTTIIYRDGDITDVVSSATTKLDGSAHTLSGAERGGFCSGLTTFDKELACFRNTADPGSLTIRGYVLFTTNASVSPAVTTSAFFDVNDVALDKATHVRVECC